MANVKIAKPQLAYFQIAYPKVLFSTVSEYTYEPLRGPRGRTLSITWVL